MDKNEIEKRINYIEERLKSLEKYLKKYESTEDYDEEYSALKTVERECEEIIESATRINQELLSDLGTIGETYRDSFEKLKQLKIFKSKNFLEKLANTTGFRNRLAHDYIDIDEKITIKSAKNILNLYSEYLLKILEYLEN